MDRVHYAGGSILTGSEIAEVLVDYAEALAQAGTSGTATVPAVSPDGEVAPSHVLVGPSSEMMTVREPSEVADPVDAQWISEYREKAVRLRREGPPAPTLVVESPTAAEPWVGDV